MCVRGFAIEADCPPETLAGIYSAILVGVCILSCLASWAFLVVCSKCKRANYSSCSSITLHSEKGDRHNVNFRIYELEDSGGRFADISSKLPLDIFEEKADESYTSSAKRTDVLWDANPSVMEGGCLRSSGQVASSCLSLTNSPAETRTSDIAPLPKTPSQWRGAQKDVKLKDLGSLKQSVIQDAWPIDSNIEYFSASNSVWVPGRIASAGVFAHADTPLYTVRLMGSRQQRFHVPMSHLRPRLLDGEPVSVYYTDNQSSEWGNAVVRGAGVNWMGYDVEVMDGRYRGPAYFKQNMANIRRRFPAGSAVLAYLGPSAGWVTGCVLEDAIENGATPGARRQLGEKAVDPEVQVRVITSPPPRFEDGEYGSPEQPEEETIIPSGCLKFAGHLSKV